MRQPFIGRAFNIKLAAKRFDRRDVLCPAIYHGALFVVEGAPFCVALDDIGPEKRPQLLGDPADTRRNREVSPERMVRLEEIIEADTR